MHSPSLSSPYLCLSRIIASWNLVFKWPSGYHYPGTTRTPAKLQLDFSGTLASSSPDPHASEITVFQELLFILFREFSIITKDIILSDHRRFRDEIIHSIEAFSKRGVIRNLQSLGRFIKEQAGLIYDVLCKAMYTIPPPTLFNTATREGHEYKPETRIGLWFRTFRQFLSEITSWSRDEKIMMNGLHVGICIDFFLIAGFWHYFRSKLQHIGREAAEHEFIWLIVLLLGCQRPLQSPILPGTWVLEVTIFLSVLILFA